MTQLKAAKGTLPADDKNDGIYWKMSLKYLSHPHKVALVDVSINPNIQLIKYEHNGQVS